MLLATLSLVWAAAPVLTSRPCSQLQTAVQGGQSVDYVGAVRVVSIAGKLIFERLTRLDSHDMVMCVSARVGPADFCKDQTAPCMCMTAVFVTLESGWPAGWQGL